MESVFLEWSMSSPSIKREFPFVDHLQGRIPTAEILSHHSRSNEDVQTATSALKSRYIIPLESKLPTLPIARCSLDDVISWPLDESS